MSPLAGNATRGHEQLGRWLDERGAQQESDYVLTCESDVIRQLLADIDTARAHAVSVFQTIRGIRPDVKIPEIR